MKTPKALAEKLSSLVVLFLALIFFTLLQLYAIREPEPRDYDESSFLCLGQMLSQGLKLGDGIFAHQPPVTFQLIGLGFRFFDDPLLAGRIPILISSLLLIIAIFLVSKELFGWKVAGYSAALSFFFPPLLFSGRIIQAEMPALACATLALFCILRSKNHPQILCFLGGVLFALGCLSKLLVAPYSLALTVALLLNMQQQELQLRSWKRCFQALFWTGIGGLFSTALILSKSDLAGLYDEAIAFHIGDARNLNLGFGADVINLSIILFKRTYPWFLMAGLGLLTLSRRRNYPPLVFLVSWFVPAVAFLLLHQPVFFHHFLIITPIIVTGAAYGFERLSQRGNMHLVIWTIVLILVCSRTSIYSLLHYRISADTQIALRTIERTTKPSEYVCSDRQLLPIIAGRPVPAELCDTSHVRIKTQTLSPQVLNKMVKKCKLLILFEGRLSHRGELKETLKSHFKLISPEGRRRYYLNNKTASVNIDFRP